MKIKSAFILTLLVLLFSFQGYAAPSPAGLWKTIDDKTGKPRSIVSIWIDKGRLYGKIILLIGEKQDSLCENCTGDKRNKPVVGMTFLSGFTEANGEWTGGTVLDPEDGKVYRGKIWCEGSSRLMLRGYVLVFYRTQTWQRINEAEKNELFKKEGVSVK